MADGNMASTAIQSSTSSNPQQGRGRRPKGRYSSPLSEAQTMAMLKSLERELTVPMYDYYNDAPCSGFLPQALCNSMRWYSYHGHDERCPYCNNTLPLVMTETDRCMFPKLPLELLLRIMRYSAPTGKVVRIGKTLGGYSGGGSHRRVSVMYMGRSFCRPDPCPTATAIASTCRTLNYAWNLVVCGDNKFFLHIGNMPNPDSFSGFSLWHMKIHGIERVHQSREYEVTMPLGKWPLTQRTLPFVRDLTLLAHFCVADLQDPRFRAVWFGKARDIIDTATASSHSLCRLAIQLDFLPDKWPRTSHRVCLEPDGTLRLGPPLLTQYTGSTDTRDVKRWWRRWKVLTGIREVELGGVIPDRIKEEVEQAMGTTNSCTASAHT